MSDRTVLRWYNHSDVMVGAQNPRLAAEGLGYVDFGTGASFDSSKAPEKRKSAAGQAFNALKAISQRGGKGVLRGGKEELITVGRWEPNCLSLRPVSDDVVLKCAQMSTFGVIDKTDDEYEDVDALFNQGRITLRHSVDPDPIDEALEMLEDQGRLRTPL